MTILQNKPKDTFLGKIGEEIGNNVTDAAEGVVSAGKELGKTVKYIGTNINNTGKLIGNIVKDRGIKNVTPLN
jgi:hypothetical protein